MKNQQRTFYLLCLSIILQLLLPASDIMAQNRTSYSINSNWQFFRGELPDSDATDKQLNWELVAIPHTWNAADVKDEVPGYYRGTSWYKKQLFIPASFKSKNVYLQFEAANQVAEVFVNGKKAGEHTGGYTAFNININPYINFNEGAANEIAIKVNNSHNEDIPPLSADFTFFGGVYRDVFLTAVDKVHFNMDDHASSGVFITTPVVSATRATVNVRGAFNNTGAKTAVWIISTIKDKNGAVIAEQKSKATALGNNRFEHNFPNITNPKLWSPDSPYLYSVTSVIQDVKTFEVLDKVTNPLGFRWFKFDASKGFFLNGKPLKLVGASRHQDFKDMGNALPDAMHVRDVELLKEMGANFLRVAHYPQDKSVLEACDRLGLLAAVEIPIVNAITETEAFSKNSKNMQVEMIRQNFNHPSVIIWAYMNEVLLRPKFAGDSLRRETYFKSIARLAQELEDITRAEDPQRYTMIPNHGNFNLYHRVGLTKIPMLVGWNLYQGWYSGKLQAFAEFLDMHHKMLPDKPLLVTEYGSDADIRLHSSSPERFDKTVEYTQLYHEVYYKAMMDRPFVSAIMAWNFADFNSEERRETDPHINNKGLMTIDRKPKDAYYFYQANLLKKPFIKIGSTDRLIRSGIAGTHNTLTQQIVVYSNQPKVSLSVNGISKGEKSISSGMAKFEVELQNGTNLLEAITLINGKPHTDRQTLIGRLIPQDLNSKENRFREINVNVGDRREFYDETIDQVWLPEQEYTKSGSWGYIGGSVYKMPDVSRQAFGTSADILGTNLDPVFQTQRFGIKEFVFDVANGTYELELHFAELQSLKKKDALAYNLGSGSPVVEQFQEKIFNVHINGQPAMVSLSSNTNLLSEQAYSIKLPVDVSNNEGIRVKFDAVLGETILNGIQVRRKF